MTFHTKIEFSSKGQINYELLQHKSIRKQNNGNIDLKIEFQNVFFFSNRSIKV